MSNLTAELFMCDYLGCTIYELQYNISKNPTKVLSGMKKFVELKNKELQSTIPVVSEKMTKREIALKNAKIILAEAGITVNDKYYSIRLYEMQFKIYQELKFNAYRYYA